MVAKRCTKQSQMPRYFEPRDVCFQVTLPLSQCWTKIGKHMAILDSGKYSLVFADGVRRAFVPQSVAQVAMPTVPPAPHLVTPWRAQTIPKRIVDGRVKVTGRWHGSQQDVMVDADAEAAPVGVPESDGEVNEVRVPGDDEDQYDHVLEHVALAFTDFLSVAQRVGMVHRHGTICALHNLSQQIDDKLGEEDSNVDPFFG